MQKKYRSCTKTSNSSLHSIGEDADDDDNDNDVDDEDNDDDVDHQLKAD